MTIKEKLTTINNALNSIKQAIVSKGQTPSGDITTYATAIGNISAANNTTLSVTPTTSAQNLSPSSPYTGYSSVSVSAVTSAIDSNITAENIKSGASILGVTGNYTGSGSGSSYFTIGFVNNLTYSGTSVGGSSFAGYKYDGTNTSSIATLFNNTIADDTNSPTIDSSSYLILYNPTAWFLYHLQIFYEAPSYVASTFPDEMIEPTFTIYGSNDNSTWTNLNFTKSSSILYNASTPVIAKIYGTNSNPTTSYNYFKITSNRQVTLTELKINAADDSNNGGGGDDIGW